MTCHTNKGQVYDSIPLNEYVPLSILQHNVKLEDLLEDPPEAIWYSASTIWWTHDKEDLCGDPGGIPLDPSGCPLYWVNSPEDVLAFLGKARIMGQASYGPHPIDSFMACNHKNIDGIDPEQWRILKLPEIVKGIEVLISDGVWEPEGPCIYDSSS